jgi:hypothetical protein
MADDAKPGHSRIRTWFCGLLAGLAAAYLFHVVSEAFDEEFGPPEAQLIVTSEAPLLDVHVSYDGRVIASRPGLTRGSEPSYALFPMMRTRKFEPVLQISWRTASGQQSLSQPMRQFDSGRLCLYVLRLDQAGDPVPPEPPDSHSPFWWTCHSS